MRVAQTIRSTPTARCIDDTRNDWRAPDDLARVLDAAAESAVAVWDFDGVFADTEPVQMDSFRVVLDRHGFSPQPGWFMPLMGHTEEQIWEMLRLQGATLPETVRLIHERRAVYLETSQAKLQPSWLAGTLVHQFHSMGTKQFVVSNGDYEANCALLNLWGLSGHVDVIPRGERSKASIVASLVADGGGIVIEDNATYLRNATEAGAFTIGVFHSLSKTPELTADVHVRL